MNIYPNHLSAKNPSPSSNSWSPKKVKIYMQVTGKTCGAHEAILDQLKNNSWTQMEFTNNPEDSYIIIVFCLIRSRVGSDLAAAMRNLPGKGHTVYTRTIFRLVKSADSSCCKNTRLPLFLLCLAVALFRIMICI